jgi:ABC-type antimicrobial peptide transport system ATPase subunit
MSALVEVESGDIILGGGGLETLSRNAGIVSLLYCGQAANQCVLTRPFGLIKMVRMGIDCALIGDLSLSILLRANMSTDDEHALVLEYYSAHIAPVVNVTDLIKEHI